MVVPHDEPEEPRKPKEPRKPRKPKEPRPSARAADRSVRLPAPASTAPLQVVNPDAAGIDDIDECDRLTHCCDRIHGPVRQSHVGRRPARMLADELQDLAQTQIPAAQNVALTAPAEP